MLLLGQMWRDAQAGTFVPMTGLAPRRFNGASSLGAEVLRAAGQDATR